MKGEVINYTHNDIYFLDTKSNSESTDLANLFASPAGREMVKFKPRVKSKHKLNPALDFFLNNKSTKTVTTPSTSTCLPSTSSSSSTTIPSTSTSRPADAVISMPPSLLSSSPLSSASYSSSCLTSSTSSSSSSSSSCCINTSSSNHGVSRTEVSRSRRSSIDLYEEAATILGLTCSQTDDCKCIECQCHYFDFEEEIDFPTGAECVMGHASTCTIQ